MFIVWKDRHELVNIEMYKLKRSIMIVIAGTFGNTEIHNRN